MDYWSHGLFLNSKFNIRDALERAKTKQAVDAAFLAVEEGKMTAKQALRHLLPEFPLIRSVQSTQSNVPVPTCRWRTERRFFATFRSASASDKPSGIWACLT